jgi:sortase A
MTAGAIILITAGIIYVLAPVAPPPSLPEALSRAEVPATLRPTAVIPTLMPESEDAALPAVLLPETPSESTLPSLARADEAPSPLEAAVSHQPVRLSIPALGIDAPIVEVGLEPVTVDGTSDYQWQAPTFYAAGWHNNSALLGETGNTVLNGHHNINGAIFRNLDELDPGEEIVLYDQERSYRYRVKEQHLLLEQDQPLAVRRANARWIYPTPDERVTIVTCWPYTDNTHRLVVIAVPAE